MISISKPKLLALVVIGLFLFLPIISSAHGLYEVTVPGNTLFAEDFNEYASGVDLHNGYGTGVNGCPATSGTANQCASKNGWGWYDNGLGGYAHVSNNNSYSGPVAMEMASSTVVGGKFDIHHIIPTSNTTTVVSLSVYMAFDNFTRNGSGGNNQMTVSIETWDYGLKYECVLFVTPGSASVQISSPDPLPNSGSINLRIAAYDDTRMVYDTGNWHHVQITCDIKNHRYLSVVIDNWNVLGQLGVTSAAMDSLSDAEILLAGKPFTIPVRMEFAQVNQVTSGLKQWHKWMDDIVVTDVTTIPTQGFFAANELWKAVAAMGIMMSVVTMYSSVRAYQEPDPLRRRMKLMVAVVFAVGAGTLAVFAIILSHL